MKYEAHSFINLSCMYQGFLIIYLGFRAIAPGVLEKDIFRIQTLLHVMKMTRTWDSTMSMIPRGGNTIWGGLDWSPEEGYSPCRRKHKNNTTQISGHDGNLNVESNASKVTYGRMISFGRDAAKADLSELKRIDFRVFFFFFFKNCITIIYSPISSD